DFHGTARYISAVPPDVFEPSNLPKQGARVGTAGQDSVKEEEHAREVAFADMKARDVANSEGADPGLVEEMEQAQRRARGEEGGSKANEPVLRQWGEEGARELQSLKRKFLLPFAAERHHPGSAETVLVAWQSPELQSGQIQVPAEYVKDVKQPLCATLEHILAQVVDYVENHFPLELLSTRRDPCLFHAIRECLQSSEFVRLTGLLAHFVYWNAFAHLHAPERQLTASTRQSLVLTAQELWSRASEPARTKLGRKKLSCGPTDSPAGMCFVIPVFLLVLKRGVEELRRKAPQSVADAIEVAVARDREKAEEAQLRKIKAMEDGQRRVAPNDRLVARAIFDVFAAPDKAHKTSLMKTRDCVRNLAYKDTSHCKYQFPYQKGTRIWTNCKEHQPQGIYCKESPCEVQAELGHHQIDCTEGAWQIQRVDKSGDDVVCINFIRCRKACAMMFMMRRHTRRLRQLYGLQGGLLVDNLLPASSGSKQSSREADTGSFIQCYKTSPTEDVNRTGL
ncbi:unnamed protein product, partial [Polarella glacialis]